MTLIHVPKPDPKSSRDPNRPVSSLLQNQVEHLQHAERRLPLRYRTEIYVKAIKTEGEAARYIREMTEAIHEAHAAAAAARARRAPKRKRTIDIAAASDESPEPKRPGSKGKKKSKSKGRRKK